MSDLSNQGAAWLARQQNDFVAKDILYTRTGGPALMIRATIGRWTFNQGDELGMVVRTESRDFIILAAELIIAGSVTLPKQGDEIREDVGAQVVMYQVLAPDGEQPWRYADLHRHSIRIHTTNVRTE